MESGDPGDAINPWGVAMFRTLQGVEPENETEQSAYDKWLDQTSEREEARHDRIHGAVGVIPTTLWIVLFFIAGVIFVFMLFFADPSERAFVAGPPDRVGRLGDGRDLLLLRRPGRPVPRRRRRLKPVAMERTLDLIDQASRRSTRTWPPVRRARESDSMTAEAERPDRVELLATLLLALATVATAWSGYQATRWNGEQAKAAARGNALRIESARRRPREHPDANRRCHVHAVGQCLRPRRDRARGLLLKRFRPEFKPAFDAWSRRPVQGRGRAAHAVRDARVRAGARRRRSSSTRRQRSSPRDSRETSSARRTTARRGPFRRRRSSSRA